MDNWLCEEFSTLDLGDKRLDRRLQCMCEQLAQNPRASIMQTFAQWPEAKAAYRALNNERVDSAQLRQAVQQACLRRLGGPGPLLVIQDTTSFEFGSHRATRGLGPTGYANGAAAGHGFHLHTALASTATGVPLGVLHQQIKVRDAEQSGIRHERRQRPIEQKDSFRWLETSRAVHAALPASQELIQIADREADIFEMFAEPRRANSYVLIRAAHDRCVSCEDQTQLRRLREAIASAPASGSFTVALTRRPDRQARQAQLALRFRQVAVQVPQNGLYAKDLSAVPLTAIEVSETALPADGGKAIHWLLLTDLPVHSFDDARRCVQYYSFRWLIERYHFTLKSGCRIEDSQLKSFEALERLLTLYCVVALRLLMTTYLARVDGQQPCTVVLSTIEWQVLHRYFARESPVPQMPPSLHEAVVWTARLGGFLARKGDGEPGLMVLWRGLMRLQDMVLALILFPPNQDVGKA